MWLVSEQILVEDSRGPDRGILRACTEYVVRRATVHATAESDGIRAPKVCCWVGWVTGRTIGDGSLVSLHSLFSWRQEHLSQSGNIVRGTGVTTSDRSGVTTVGNRVGGRGGCREWGGKGSGCVLQFEGNGTCYQFFLCTNEV